MKECPKCHDAYSGNPDNCPNCKTRLGTDIHNHHYVDTNADSRSGSNSIRSKNIPPDNYTCYEAESLNRWGKYFPLSSIIIAIVTAIARGFQATTNRYGTVIQEFDSSAMFSVGNVINVLLWIGGGYAFGLILDSFAVVVEASYRSMTKD